MLLVAENLLFFKHRQITKACIIHSNCTNIKEAEETTAPLGERDRHIKRHLPLKLGFI